MDNISHNFHPIISSKNYRNHESISINVNLCISMCHKCETIVYIFIYLLNLWTINSQLSRRQLYEQDISTT